MPLDEVRLLVRTPRPRDGEGFMGFLLRTTEANGCPGPYWLLRAFGCSAFAVATATGLKRLADALALDEATLESMRCAPAPSGAGPGRVRFGSDLVHRSVVAVNRSRHCPRCLEEEGFFRLAWNLKPVTACPRHGITLQERCPACERPVLWSREELFRCPCGHDLRHSAGIPADPASLALSQALMEKAGNWSVPSLQTPLPPPFADLGLGDLVDHALFLGAYVSGNGRGAGRHAMAHLMGDAGIDVFQRVAAILAEWPKGFFAVLDDIRRHGGEEVTRTGFQAEFRSFYAALYSRRFMAAGSLQVIREAFEAYLHQHWTGGFLGAKNRRLTTTLEEGLRHVPLAQAARLIGMHPLALEREVQAGMLAVTTRQMGKRTLTLVDREELERYRVERDQLIGAPEARRLLGLSKAPFLDLVRVGLVKAVRGPGVDGHALWLFRRADIRQVLDSLLLGAPETVPGPEHIGFRKALRAATYRGRSVTDLVRAITGGSLRVAGADPRTSGVERCYFDADAVLAFLGGGRAYTDWTVSVEEAGAQLGLKGQVAYHLVRQGLLRTVSVTENGKTSRRVPLDAIPEFVASYVPAAELAVQYGTSSRHLVAVLQEHGIAAVTGPTVDSGRQYFFSRSRLAKADASEILLGLRASAKRSA
ncbi:MAG TPA: TniQ family protein [Azospirillaceae bacterium]|nr:TniQ family protein [Azospirillaceae bacterium]